jgi:hypothetical protein
MSEQSDQRWVRPVEVRGRLEEPLSRWLWLVKWLLLIPHYVVLFFLWLAFGLVTIAAFFAILVTGRYPHSLFTFNLGVLRWSWRVSYYGYSALGTDRYPPFSLGAEPDYPATLDIVYPGRLSRGLVLVKWWLLAIPQYIVLGVLLGGAATATTTMTRNGVTWTTVTTAGTGLVPLLVFFAGVALLFTAVYPSGLFAFVMGLNRWVLRVMAYVSLMTDRYPPFRLDQGGDEFAPPPSGPLPGSSGGVAVQPPVAAPAIPPGAPPPQNRPAGSSAGPIVALVAGLLVLLVGLGLGAGGIGALWLGSRRDAAGFVASNQRTLTTPTAALAAEDVNIDLGSGADAWVPSDRFGTVRVRAESTDGGPVFIGIAPQSAIDGWLDGVAYDEVQGVGRTVTYIRHDGTVEAAAAPTAQTFWAASTTGAGRQELTWRISSGQWGIVIARPDGEPGVTARVDVGASIPDLTGLGVGLLVVAGIVILGAAALIVVGAAGLGRRSATPPPAAPPMAPAQPPPAPLPGQPRPEDVDRPVGRG